MKIDFSREIKFKTARSGGKGGQHVNKVETMVEGYFHVMESGLLNDEQKKMVLEKLSNRINAEGFLLVKSQEERSQLANKQRVAEKINLLINQALKKQKKRVPTKLPAIVKEKRLESKKRKSDLKTTRKKWKPDEE